MDRVKGVCNITADEHFERAEKLYHEIKKLQEDLLKLGECGSLAYDLMVEELEGEILESGGSIDNNDLKMLMSKVNLIAKNDTIKYLEYMKKNKRCENELDISPYFCCVIYVVKYYNAMRKSRVNKNLTEDDKYEIEVRLEMGDDYEERVKKNLKRNKVNVADVKAMFSNFFVARLLKMKRNCDSMSLEELIKESDLDVWMEEQEFQNKVIRVKNKIEEIQYLDDIELLNDRQNVKEMMLMDDLHDELAFDWVKDAIQIYEKLEG